MFTQQLGRNGNTMMVIMFHLQKDKEYIITINFTFRVPNSFPHVQHDP